MGLTLGFEGLNMLEKVAGARAADCSWFATRWICVVAEERNTGNRPIALVSSDG